MPVKRAKKITAWSHSRKRDYDDCPRKAKYKVIDRLREPASKAMERGSRIHKLAEDYVAGRIGDALPAELDTFPEEFAQLRKLRRHVGLELELAVTRDWVPCDWFDSSAWLRAKLDVGYTDPMSPERYIAIDHKTGRTNPAAVAQLDLYAAVVFAHKPDVDVVDASLWYLDEGEVLSRAYTRESDEATLRKRWVAETRKMLSDTTFAPTPGNACRWCYFGQSGVARGGPGLCEY